MILAISIGVLILILMVGLNLKIRKKKEISLFGKHGPNFSARVIIQEDRKGFPFIYLIQQKIVEQSNGQLPHDIVLEKDKILKNYKIRVINYKLKGVVINVAFIILMEAVWIFVAAKGLNLSWTNY